MPRICYFLNVSHKRNSFFKDDKGYSEVSRGVRSLTEAHGTLFLIL